MTWCLKVESRGVLSQLSFALDECGCFERAKFGDHGEIGVMMGCQEAMRLVDPVNGC